MLQDHCARPLVTTPLPSTLRGSHNPLATGPSLPCSQCSSHQGVSGRAAGPSPHGVQMWRVLPNPGLRGGSPQDGRATGQSIIPSPSSNLGSQGRELHWLMEATITMHLGWAPPKLYPNFPGFLSCNVLRVLTCPPTPKNLLRTLDQGAERSLAPASPPAACTTKAFSVLRGRSRGTGCARGGTVRVPGGPRGPGSSQELPPPCGHVPRRGFPVAAGPATSGRYAWLRSAGTHALGPAACSSSAPSS